MASRQPARHTVALPGSYTRSWKPPSTIGPASWKLLCRRNCWHLAAQTRCVRAHICAHTRLCFPQALVPLSPLHCCFMPSLTSQVILRSKESASLHCCEAIDWDQLLSFASWWQCNPNQSFSTEVRIWAWVAQKNTHPLKNILKEEEKFWDLLAQCGSSRNACQCMCAMGQGKLWLISFILWKAPISGAAQREWSKWQYLLSRVGGFQVKRVSRTRVCILPHSCLSHVMCLFPRLKGYKYCSLSSLGCWASPVIIWPVKNQTGVV